MSIAEPSTVTHSFFWGVDGRRGGKKFRLAWMLYWQGGFPELQSCPIRLDSCWLQLVDVYVCICLSFIGVYAWLQRAACLPAGPVTRQPRMWVFTDVFLRVVFVSKWYFVYVSVHLLYLNAYLLRCSKSPEQLPPTPPHPSSHACPWWLPETSALHSVSVTRVSSLLQTSTPQQNNGASLLLSRTFLWENNPTSGLKYYLINHKHCF